MGEGLSADRKTPGRIITSSELPVDVHPAQATYRRDVAATATCTVGFAWLCAYCCPSLGNDGVTPDQPPPRAW
jgi:hypothetical protein